MNKINLFISKTFKAKRMNFLGVKNAGKTQLLETLGCPGVRAGVDSMSEQYPKFSINFSKIGKSEVTFIHGGRDYGGELNIFKAQYAKMIRKGDIVIYVIDAKKFINNDIDEHENIKYSISVLQRLDHINSNTPLNMIEKFSVVLTHADEFDDKKEVVTKFQKIVSSNIPQRITPWIKYYYVVNAKDQNDVLNTFYKILHT